MRNKVIAAILSAFVLLIISCSSVDDNKAPEALVAKKVAVPKNRKITKTVAAKNPQTKTPIKHLH